MSEENQVEVKQEQEFVHVMIYRLCKNCNIVSLGDAWKRRDVEVEDVSYTGGTCPVCGAFCLDENTLDAYNEILEQLEEYQIEITLPEAFEAYNIIPGFTKEELADLDSVKKKLADLKEEEKKKQPKIKDFLVEHGIREFVFEGHKMILSWQDRGKMDEDKLTAAIKKCCTPEQIEAMGLLKEIVNPDALEEAMKNGLVTIKDIASCKIRNDVAVFNLNPKPKKGSKKKITEGFGGNF